MIASPELTRAEIDLLTEEELAAALDIEVSTLVSWRSEKSGPAYVKLGKSVFYRRSHIDQWAESCRTGGPVVWLGPAGVGGR